MELSEAPVMEKVKRGFKHTEAGMIPLDWEVATLESCLELLTDFESNGSFADVAANVVVHDHEEYAWYVRATDLENDSTLSTVRYVDRRSFEFLKKTRLYGGEVLITKRGEIGKVYFFKARTSFATVAPNLYLLKLNCKVVPQYVFNYFKYGRGNVTLKTINASTTLGALYKNDVKSLLLPLPSVPEQRAIATALSDVDALLGSLDTLIAKKKAIKQGAMQQLLTGKQRLPGFKGEWEVKTFGDVVRHHAGNSTLIKGKLHAAPASGLFNGYSASGQDVWLQHFEHEGEALIVSAVGSRCGRSFRASGKWCAIANTHVVWAKRDKVDMRFLGLYINDENFWLKSGSGQPFVLVRQSFGRRLPLPPKEEQAAIATALSDMDAEISALEARRAKTALLKQGMMQELLTGRTRLV